MSGRHIADRLEFAADRIPVNYFGVGSVLISQKNLSVLRLILGCERASGNGSAIHRNDGHVKFSNSLPRLILGLSSH